MRVRASIGRIRPAAVAGRFYPGDPEQLRATVRSLLEASGESADPRMRVLIAPHAGYPYSGPTAAHAYARIDPAAVRRIFLLGRSHRYRFDGVSFSGASAFETPLGLLPLDHEAIAHLAANVDTAPPEAHDLEHTLEVQLPFLQTILGPAPIVPMLLGEEPGLEYAEFGAFLASQMNEDDLLVISTDLSHYLSEQEANKLDQASLNLVLQQSPAAVCMGAAEGACSMCGASAVVAGMAAALALRARQWTILDYRTSGAASGDFDRVVGYGALSMARAA